MVLDVPEDLMHVSFFFIDIVGLSNPEMSTTTQTTKIKSLNKLVDECKTFTSTPPDEKLVLPTGDGMAVGFLHGIESPINLAIELHEKLRNYNADKSQMDKILARIGCHNGNVFVVKDILGNKNFWGPGIILARRVMDIGDAGHILMTSSMAESLLEMSDDYKNIIHPIYDYEIKHGQSLILYSVHNEAFGNPENPKKRIIAENKEESKLNHKNVSYPKAEFNINLKDVSNNILNITKTYEFENISDEPLFELKTGLVTSSEKSFSQLNVIAKDHKNQPITISKILVDSNFRKEFVIKLNDPVFKGDQNNAFSIIYDDQEPEQFYENLFLINIKKLVIKFSFSTNKDIKPNLYFMSHKDREKKLIEQDSRFREGIKNTVQWIVEDGSSEKDIIRLEW